MAYAWEEGVTVVRSREHKCVDYVFQVWVWICWFHFGDVSDLQESRLEYIFILCFKVSFVSNRTPTRSKGLMGLGGLKDIISDWVVELSIVLWHPTVDIIIDSLTQQLGFQGDQVPAERLPVCHLHSSGRRHCGMRWFGQEETYKSKKQNWALNWTLWYTKGYVSFGGCVFTYADRVDSLFKVRIKPTEYSIPDVNPGSKTVNKHGMIYSIKGCT